MTLSLFHHPNYYYYYYHHGHHGHHHHHHVRNWCVICSTCHSPHNYSRCHLCVNLDRLSQKAARCGHAGLANQEEIEYAALDLRPCSSGSLRRIPNYYYYYYVFCRLQHCQLNVRHQLLTSIQFAALMTTDPPGHQAELKKAVQTQFQSISKEGKNEISYHYIHPTYYIFSSNALFLC